LYREKIQAGLRVDQFAAELNRHPDTAELSPVVAGWDCWAKKGVIQSGMAPTIAEEFLKHHIILNRAVIDRIQGAAQIRNYLAWQNLSNGRTRPRFFIFDTCPISFDGLSRMEHDPAHVEDVLKVDAVEGDPYSGDDAYDMIRYALMTRPISASPEIIQYPLGSRGYLDQQAKKLEESIDLQAKRQQAKENDEDVWNLSGIDEPQDIASYYLNKRR
jgi:hypothetical protein